MRDWLSIPILYNALWVLAAGVVIPLIFGLIARMFFFELDKDDERNDPDKAHQLKEKSAEASADTPEPNPVNEDSWPAFNPSSKGQT